jgi:hypothetical protein
VEVLDREHDRRFSRERGDPRDIGATRLGRIRGHMWLALNPQQPAEVHQGTGVVRILAEQGNEAGPRPCLHDDLGVTALDVEPAPEDLDEGPGLQAAVRQALALEPRDAIREERAQLGEHAGLADARLADDQEGLSAPGSEVLDDGTQARDLGIPADQRPQPPLARLDPGADEPRCTHGL